MTVTTVQEKRRNQETTQKEEKMKEKEEAAKEEDGEGEEEETKETQFSGGLSDQEPTGNLERAVERDTFWDDPEEPFFSPERSPPPSPGDEERREINDILGIPEENGEHLQNEHGNGQDNEEDAKNALRHDQKEENEEVKEQNEGEREREEGEIEVEDESEGSEGESLTATHQTLPAERKRNRPRVPTEPLIIDSRLFSSSQTQERQVNPGTPAKPGRPPNTTWSKFICVPDAVSKALQEYNCNPTNKKAIYAYLCLKEARKKTPGLHEQEYKACSAIRRKSFQDPQSVNLEVPTTEQMEEDIDTAISLSKRRTAGPTQITEK